VTKFFILILLLFRVDCIGQIINAEDSFNYEIFKATGDLNNDNLPDRVVVSQDTLSDKSPYRLQIFFAEPNGKFKLIVTSTKIIEPENPNGRDGYNSGNRFTDVTIKNGVVSINFELIRGHYEHKFRWQNGNFELIGFSEVYSDGKGEMETIDFNLSTGTRIEKTERYDTDKILSNKKKKILIRPLPKLQDVIPMENELY